MAAAGSAIGTRSVPSSAGASVAVIIVNYGTAELTKACLARLEHQRTTLPTMKVVVVDGGSADGSADKLQNAANSDDYREWVTFLPLPINGGFGWANNQAISLLLQSEDPPEFIHLLNPDSEIENGAVLSLLSYLTEHQGVGAVGSQLLELDGSLTGSAFSFPSIRGEFSRGARTGFFDVLFKVPPISVASTEPREVDWATGASVMFRAEALKQVGLFDEGFFLYHEEIELMWRLRRAGWSIAFEPRSRVRHVGGASTGVHSRRTEARVEPRKPKYWFRSRARYFALTRGRGVATLAYFAFLLGYPIWALRYALRLPNRGKPISHQLRDHLRFALPRASDNHAAQRPWNSRPTENPMWMDRRWV
jgi:N-acetylglucosaminyl-diphospho-decaprenol L-rhamnosyltransferase